MAFLLVYIAINVVIAIVLDRKKMHKGAVAHVILLFCSLFVVFICSGIPFVREGLRNLLGNRLLRSLEELFVYATADFLLPSAVVESVLILQLIAIAACLTTEIVTRMVKTTRARKLHLQDTYVRNAYGVDEARFNYKLYYRFGALLR